MKQSKCVNHSRGPGMNANMLQWRTEKFNSSKIFKLVIIGIPYEMIHKAGTRLEAYIKVVC